jgi:hypothetical protein
MAAQKPRDEARNTTKPGNKGPGGMTLEKWLAAKEKEREEERRAAAQDAKARAAEVAPAKKPNLFRRLLDKAQQPLKGSR